MLNDTIMTSRRRLVLTGLTLSLAPTMLLIQGCSPQFNWRQTTDEDGLWLGQFPGKPASITRSVRLQTPTGGFPIRLRLVAARVKNLQFTIGTALPGRQDEQQSSSPAPGEAPAPLVRPEDLELIRLGLEDAMLKNLNAQAEQRTLKPAPEGRLARHLLTARGEIRLEASSPPVPARLQMQTVVLQDRVLEAVVAGPEADFIDDVIAPFFEAFRPGVEMYRPG